MRTHSPEESTLRVIRSRQRTPAVVTWTVVALALTSLVGCSTATTSSSTPSSSATSRPSATPTATPTPTPTPTFDAEAADAPAEPVAPTEAVEVVASDTNATAGTALALLDTIAIKGRAPKTGYDREGMFGSAWLDVDRNGCDTRNDMLARDLTEITTEGPCKVMTGSLTSPFTAEHVDFVRGNTTSALVQIDHVVALSNAWQTGAQQLSQAQRISLANDPINLLAVDGSSNSSKGDGDAATWLPANKSFRCTYVAAQVSVKATYGLWVTQAERDAIARVLGDCPDQPAVTSGFTPAPAPEPEPAPEPAPVVEEPAPAPAPVVEPAPAPVAEPAPAPVAPVPSDVFYQNCDAVRAAGAAPIYAGQPGYSRKLDRDGDGVGCE